MSKIEVQTIDAPSGQNTVTIGDSNASTITLKSGATLTNFPANTPAFSAYQSGTGTSLTQNSYTKVVWDSEYYDTNSAFSSGRFTVPSGKAGKYFFTSTVSMQNALAEINIDLYKNGNTYWRGSAVQGGNYASAMSVSGVMDLAVGDYVEVYVKQNQSTNAVESGDEHSHFQGFKLT